MNASEVRAMWPHLTASERAEVERIIAADLQAAPWRPQPGPQSAAYWSDADVLGFGGSAGGGKTDLICGLASTVHHRSLVVRREKAQTEGIVQRLTEILNSTDGYSSQKGAWHLPGGKLMEFGGLDNPGDERRYQGRAHDLKCIDEATECREAQVRYVIGWNRTARSDVKPRVLLTFNPPTTSEGRWVLSYFAPWLDKKHPGERAASGELRHVAMTPAADGNFRDTWMPDGRQFVLSNGVVEYNFDPADFRPEDIITPKTRCFIASRMSDNAFYAMSGYASTLQALPEPLRSQMLYGDFDAGVSDDEWQAIPTAWIEAAQARWKPRRPRGEMLQMGMDVARGGRDATVVAMRHRDNEAGHDWWFDELRSAPGKETPDGDEAASVALIARRDDAPINVDALGIGASAYDSLRRALPFGGVTGVVVNESATGKDRSGRLAFVNKRAQLVWALRDLMDPAADTGIALPPDPALLQELCAFRFKMPTGKIQVNSRDEIIGLIGRSPDRATAVKLAAMETPKTSKLKALGGQDAARKTLEYDPYA
jgi:hypothetical protein